jgi:SsrA-binding protein
MAKKKTDIPKDATGEQIVCRNRKATFKFEILDRIEAGMVLTGTEVKSLRAGQGSIEEAYAMVTDGELWLHKLEIPEYAMGNVFNHPVKRTRKLLLHKREIAKFAEGASQKGFTLVPLRLYFKNGRAKIEIGLAKGKKLHDKRDTIKTREVKRDISRATGERRKKF